MKRFLFVVGFTLWMGGGIGCGSPSQGPSSGVLTTPAIPASNTPQTPFHPLFPPSPARSVHFFTFGDWGTGDSNQKAVADAAAQICLAKVCDFGLLLGDNFYFNGVTGTADPQWQSKYRDVYSGLNVPFYALLGNHDWDPPADPQAQIDYSMVDSSWHMPSGTYSFHYPVSGDSIVEIFVINSNDFKTDTAAQSQLSFSLLASTAPWKIVAFHHPILDNGEGHSPDEKGNYPTLKPIVCGKVDLLLSGHEHNLQHLRDVAEGCGHDQIIVGTGGQSLYDADLTPDVSSVDVLYAEKNFGLGFFEADATSLTFRFFRTDGQEGYSYTWKKP
ncbi:MAG: metallophosphoesterase [bacterium]